MQREQLSGLFGDFRLLVMLFITLRLALLLAYQPMMLTTGERGLTTGGDLFYHYQLASFSAEGKLPFIHWWSEFPPVPAWLNTTLYTLLGENVNYTSWSVLFAFVMIACDVGLLWLMRAIGTRLYSAVTGMALAWIYALMVAPVIYTWWNFEVLVAFTFMLSVWWLLKAKDTQSALMTAFGALVKFTPALILGAVLRYQSRGQALRYIAIVAAVFVSVYALFFAVTTDARFVTASLTAQFGKASYESVWALIDGNYTTGNFAAPGVDMVQVHLDPDGATRLYGNPAVIPSWARLAVAGALGLFIFWRTRRTDDVGLVAFIGATVLIFFLQAQGWSPQWIVQIIPFILLVFPTRNGVLICLLLTCLCFVEYPLLFIRTGESETPGVISGYLRMPYIVVVVSRTLLLVGVVVAFYNKLRQLPIKYRSEALT